jgi:hypothetical protein
MNPKLNRKRRQEMDDTPRFERAHYKRLRNEKSFSEDDRGWSGQYGQHPANEEETTYCRTENAIRPHF